MLPVLLVLLALVYFILPVADVGNSELQICTNAAFSLVLIFGIALTWGRHELFAIAATVGSCALAFRWLDWLTPTQSLKLWDDGSSVAAIVVFSIILLSGIFSAGRVRQVRIQGAVAIYLLFGIGWAHAHRMVETLKPSSYASSSGPITNFSDWMYFSLATLSTLGYGDIVPTDRVARMLSAGEAIAGQLYLAILIARLVALEVASSRSLSRSDESLY